MSAATSLHRDGTGRKLTEKLQNLSLPQLLAQSGTAIAIGLQQLKYILHQVEPDRDNLRHDRPPLWIIAAPPWHIDAAGGGHIIRAVLSSKCCLGLVFRYNMAMKSNWTAALRLAVENSSPLKSATCHVPVAVVRHYYSTIAS